ncbi:MAG TPA: ABC transporter permease [Dehalococcoidia bacterium]|nr:ABC transporter permease [Dehalococcoidia bacterium]
MSAYTVRRVLWIIPVLLVVSLITFALMHLVPGGPWDREKNLAPAIVENLNRKYNLDKPVWEQYLVFVWNASHGDLGISYTSQDKNVSEIILRGFPITATLGLVALAFALVVGLGLGILSALRQNSWIDYVSLFFATLGASTPNFVSAIVLIIVLAVGLHLLKTGGWGSPDQIIMPAIALGLAPAAFLTRITRASLLEALGQDYVRTARAKGLSEKIVLVRHTFKNALIPIVTVLGPITANLVTGSFIIENVFAIPGIGRIFVQGIGSRDYALIMGAVLFYAIIVAVANLAVDLVYGVVDPRIRYT